MFDLETYIALTHQQMPLMLAKSVDTGSLWNTVKQAYRHQVTPQNLAFHLLGLQDLQQQTPAIIVSYGRHQSFSLCSDHTTLSYVQRKENQIS